MNSPKAPRRLLSLRVVILLLVVGLVFTLASRAIRGRKTEVAGVAQAPDGAIPTTTSTTLAPLKPSDPFFMGQVGQSGCYVCHGDAKLVKIVDGKPKSFYVNEAKMTNGAHKDVACTSCHMGFGSESHVGKPSDWQTEAFLSCIRCHTHDKQTAVYLDSIHGKLALAEQPGKQGGRAATCGDCHSGHDIKKITNDPAARAELHGDAERMCGDCHADYWSSYADYYHGRAYKAGAPDAPACWDCHGYHDVRPRTDPRSKIVGSNLAKSCAACHPGAGASFVEYAQLVHSKGKAWQQNLGWRYIGGVLSWAGSKIQAIRGQAPSTTPPGSEAAE